MNAGDTVIMIVQGPASEGLATLARIRSIEGGVITVNDMRFQSFNKWVWDSEVRHMIEADTQERRAFWNLSHSSRA